MIIDIDRLTDEGLHFSKEFEFFSEDLVEEDAVFLKPVYADVFVRKVGEEVFIQGRLSSCLSFVCSRCLVPFEFPIDSKFDLVLLPEELDIPKEQLDPEDMDRMFYTNRTLDIKEIVQEQLNLTFPVKPLCSAECQGICPVCGKIIKEGECSCLTAEPDPRLDKLKTFLKDKR